VLPAEGDAPPEAPEGACWARDTIPAVIETQMVQVMTGPSGADGSTGFRSTTEQKIVQDRRDVWFRTPCPGDFTISFIASLQRALKARGFFDAPVTGTLDEATGQAIRQYQAPLGLDSAVLSLQAARDLGLVPADLATP
jgi:peptidoglycan hydrolase-like protein with peptidoglycan-binding domain